jgi:hypothetical protein
MGSPLSFKILAVDDKHKASVRSAANVCHALAGNGALLAEPVKVDTCAGTVQAQGMQLIVKSIDHGAEQALSSYVVEARSEDLDDLAKLRLPLVEHLQAIHFSSVYVLVDDVSRQYANKLYPLIYDVENALRAYIIEFMVTRIGPQWWNLTATSDQHQKAQQRKGNESFFGAQLIDSRAYLIDFGDLGSIIHTQSSGAQTKEDILKKIKDLDETPEAIRRLKGELESNYVKFFAASFRDKGFQQNWEELEKLRHKVAHNGLLSSEDLEKGNQTSSALTAILQEASAGVADVVLEEQDRKAIQETVQRWSEFIPISEDQFLEELERAEAHFSDKGSFVGIGHFIKNWLGQQGFDYKSVYDMSERLQAMGRIELYKIPGDDYATTAVRIIDSGSP